MIPLILSILPYAPATNTNETYVNDYCSGCVSSYLELKIKYKGHTLRCASKLVCQCSVTPLSTRAFGYADTRVSLYLMLEICRRDLRSFRPLQKGFQLLPLGRRRTELLASRS